LAKKTRSSSPYIGCGYTHELATNTTVPVRVPGTLLRVMVFRKNSEVR
jgi:hypothetical protein